MQRKYLVARIAALGILISVLTACSTTSGPVEPGYYRVEQGDTLYRIAQKHGQSVDDLVRWNKLSSSSEIDAGMLLRVRPPVGAPSSSAPPPAPVAGATARAKPSSPPAKVAPAPAPVRGISLAWPANGKVIQNFNDKGSHGLTIANAEGTPVVAAAAGKVGYAGNGLRGYGNLVIVRHAGDFLSIYAHNRKLLVKEGESVRQGQPIAEMGKSDARQPELYFELRKGRTPVNPRDVLPAR